MRTKSLATLTCTLLVLQLSAAAVLAEGWNFQIADAAGDMGYYSKIVVASNGTPYILYRSGGQFGRLYLAWPGAQIGSWQHRYLAGGDGYPSSIGLVCDSHDNLHIAFNGSGQVYYGVFSSESGDWLLAPEVAAADSPWGVLALAVSESGGVVIPDIVYAPGDHSLSSARRDPLSGTWTSQSIYQTHTVQSPSLIADAAGHFHASFYDADGGKLLYATDAPDGVWNGVQFVDIAGNVGSYNSIAIDASGRPCIAYYDATNGDLKFARLIP